MSSFSDFSINCCRKNFRAKRFKVKPFLKGVLKEEIKIIYWKDKTGNEHNTCPVCGQVIIERIRLCKKENGKLKRYTARLIGKHADFYLIGVDKKEIFNYSEEKGSKYLANWFYYYKNKRFDLNDKRRDREENISIGA